MEDTTKKILSDTSVTRVKQVIMVPNSINKIHDIFKKHGFKLFLVGGSVRDTLIGRRPKDFDLATDATPDKIKELLSMYPTIESGEQFGVVNVVTEDDTYEIATFREDIGKGRRPDDVKYSTIEKDVLRRDLTINALFYDLDTQEIVDMVGGIEDLKNGIIKTVGKAEDRFNEDKLRIMRTMRFAARVGSDVDEGISEAIKKDSSTISGDGKPLSQERIHDEFIKGIKQAKSTTQFINLLKKYDLLKWVFCGLLDVDGNIVETNNPTIVVASLLSNNIGKINKGLIDLKFTKKMSNQIEFLVNFLNRGGVETAFEFKNIVKNIHLDGGVISKFGKLNKMDHSLLNAFNKYQITTDGKKLLEQGFSGKGLHVEKVRIETELFKILISKPIVDYSGVILDKPSHDKLVNLLYHHFQDLKGLEIYSHHMTISTGPLPLQHRCLMGIEKTLRVTHIGESENVIAVKVEVDIDLGNKTPHVTLATTHKGNPSDSNLINDWQKITPFNVYGVILEVPR